MVAAMDSKSIGSDTVWVRIPPWAPLELSIADTKVLAIFLYIGINTANINDFIGILALEIEKVVDISITTIIYIKSNRYIIINR